MNLIDIKCLGCGKISTAPADIVEGRHLRCPFCDAKFSYSHQLRVGEAYPESRPDEERGSMLVRCQECGKTIVVQDDLEVGQHVWCPYCERKFSYLKDDAGIPGEENKGQATDSPRLKLRQKKSRKCPKGLVFGRKEMSQDDRKEMVRVMAHYEEKRRKREWKRLVTTRAVACAAAFCGLLIALAAYFTYHVMIDARIEAHNSLAEYIRSNNRILCDCHSQYSRSIRECRDDIWQNRDDKQKVFQLRASIQRFEGVQLEIEAVNLAFSKVAPHLGEMSLDELRAAQTDLALRIRNLSSKIRGVGFTPPVFVEMPRVSEPKTLGPVAADVQEVRSVRPLVTDVNSPNDKPHDVRTRKEASALGVRKVVESSIRQDQAKAEVDRLIQKLKESGYGFDPQSLKKFSLQEQKSILEEMLDDAKMLMKRAR